MWRAVQDLLPTYHNLATRKIMDESGCPRCWCFPDNKFHDWKQVSFYNQIRWERPVLFSDFFWKATEALCKPD